MNLRQQAMKELARRELQRREQSSQGRPNVLEEMHEDISVKDRAIVKNFSNNPEQAAKYLAKQTGLQTKVYDGEIIAKRENETEWRKLDPDAAGFDGFGELAMDIGDIAYDVGSGVVEGAATIAAGVPTLGLGAAPAAAATAGASETLRQGIGKALGVNEEMDMGQVGAVAAISGAVPVLGKYAAPAVKKAASSMLKGAPKALSIIGNQSQSEIEALSKGLGTIEDMEAKGITPFIEDARTKAVEAVKSATGDIGKQIEQTIKNAGNVDISSAKNAAFKRVEDLQLRMEKARTPSNVDDYNAAVDAYNKNFGIMDENTGELIGEVEDIVDAETAWRIQQSMRSESKSFKAQPDSFKSRFPKSSDVSSKETSLAFDTAEKEINKSFDAVTGGKATELKGMYAQQKELEDSLTNVFKSADTMDSALRTVDTDNKLVRRELLDHLDKTYGTNLIDMAGKLKNFRTFGKGVQGYEGLSAKEITKQTPLSWATSSVGGIIGWGAGSAKGALAGAGLGSWVGKKLSSPKAIRKYVEAAIEADKIAGKLDENTKKWLEKELYKKIKNSDAVRETLKKAMTAEDRG